MSRRRRDAPAEERDSRESRICSLAIVADHIFHQEVGEGDIATTVLIMLYHIKEANAVFMTKVRNSLLNSQKVLIFQRILTMTQSQIVLDWKYLLYLSLNQKSLTSIFCWVIMRNLRYTLKVYKTSENNIISRTF